MKTTHAINNKKNNQFVLFFMITSLFFFVSCKKDNLVTPSKEAKAMSTRESPKSTTATDQLGAAGGKQQQIHISQPVLFIYTIIKIDHHAARSWSPDYSVTVSSDGKVEFEGRRNVATIGRKEMKISSSDLQLLKGLFDAAGFFSMDDDLPNIADSPTVYTTYSRLGHSSDETKTLKDYNNGIPLALIELRIKTESILNISPLVTGHISTNASYQFEK